MGGDDYKFVAGLLATMAAIAAVVFTVYLRDLDMPAATGAKVDLEKIEAMADKGSISLHEASHWEEVEAVQ